jgi:hypothetical protein
MAADDPASPRAACLELLLSCYPEAVPSPPRLSLPLSPFGRPLVLSLELPDSYPRELIISLEFPGSKQTEAGLRALAKSFLLERGVGDGRGAGVGGEGAEAEEGGNDFVALDLVNFLAGSDESADRIELALGPAAEEPASAPPPPPPRPAAPALAAQLATSEPILAKGSQFLAFGARLSDAADFAPLYAHLCGRDSKMRRATHHMFAYRVHGEGGTVTHDNGDDGEDGAGAKIAEVLRNMMKGGEGGAAVVVSRWYGGTKLGPLRWRLISNAAREVMVKMGYGAAA